MRHICNFSLLLTTCFLSYNGEADAKALAEARKCREDGYSTVMMKQEKAKEEYEAFAKTQNFAKVEFI